MASKAIVFFSFTLLLLSLLSQVHSKHNLPLPSGLLIRNYRGSQRGDKAHATPPTEGIFHYDGDENWSLVAAPGTMHLETVGLHEIGHMLGLAHSPVKEAVMFAYTGSNEVRGLHQDDIAGIKALYNW
ncbi:hypothetical protein SLA2020_052000 [Shorea laevis]